MLLLVYGGCVADPRGDWPLYATVFPATRVRPQATDAITVATYNLHRLRDTEGLREDLRHIQADVWLFQETLLADLRSLLPNGEQWNIAIVPVNAADGTEGGLEAQVIASRLPITRTEVWPLASHGHRRRCALTAWIRVGDYDVIVVDTDHEPGYLSSSVAHAPQLDALADRLSGQEQIPTIVGGDFNTCGNFWRLRSSRADAQIARRQMRDAGFTLATTQPEVTFFAGPVRGYLDAIYVKQATVTSSVVVRDARGSDHRPVVARISLAPIPP
jgi:endonuclease/exonuclease/phosphatase (EEP) superfamily protein YafD